MVNLKPAMGLKKHELPFPWQEELLARFRAGIGNKMSLDIPTVLGITSLMAAWLVAKSQVGGRGAGAGVAVCDGVPQTARHPCRRGCGVRPAAGRCDRRVPPPRLPRRTSAGCRSALIAIAFQDVFPIHSNDVTKTLIPKWRNRCPTL